VTRGAAALAAALALLATAAPVAEAADQRVLRVDVQSGEVTTLAAPAEGEIVFWRPLALRHDGSMLLHTTRQDGVPAGDFLEERAADGTLLVRRRRAETHHFEQIGPDLRHVAFFEFARGRSYATVARADGAERRRVAWAQGVETIESGWAGDRLVVARVAGRETEVMTFSRGLTATARVRCPAPLYPSRIAGAPDGTRTAVTLTTRRFGSRLALVDHASRSCRTLPVDGLHPAWSPDSRLIAAADTGRGVWVVDPGTGRGRLARSRRLIDALTWSPDGSRIAVASAGAGPTWEEAGSVHVIDPATGRWREVLPATTGTLSRPFWSPDGRSIIVAVS
jgi:hypothetical protein